MRAFQTGIPRAGRWIVIVGVVGAIGAATPSAGSGPAARSPSATATQRAVAGLRSPAFAGRAKAKPKLGGVILGGVDKTSGFAHIIQVNRKLTRVQGWAGIELNCTPSGDQPDIPDSFPPLKLGRRQVHRATGTIPVDTGDPHVTMTVSDSVSGKINARHTKASGSGI